MKTSFTPDQVRQLLSLPESQQQEILDYSDALFEATDEEIVNSVVDDDAPELIHQLHNHSVRRARAAIARRERRLQSSPAALSDESRSDENRLSHSAVRRLQWIIDTFASKIGDAISNYINEVVTMLSTLSPVQKTLAFRSANAIMMQLTRPLLQPLAAAARP